MDETIEISDESNDTIICNGLDESSSESQEILKIVNKYIAKNCSTSASEKPALSPTNDNPLLAIYTPKDVEDTDESKNRKGDLNSLNVEDIVNNFISSSGELNKYDYDDSSDDAASPKRPKANVVAPQQENVPPKVGAKPKLSKEEKEQMKQEKLLERQRKRDEAARDKAVKQALATANKNIKPDECLKFITVSIDNGIVLENHGQTLVKFLEEMGLNSRVQSQIVKNSITVYRKIQNHAFDQNDKLIDNFDVQETEEVLLIFSCKDLLCYISDGTLSGHIQSIKTLLNKKRCLLGIVGLKQYFRHQKNLKNHKIRSEITDSTPSINRKFKSYADINVRDIEWSLTELQLTTSSCYKILENDADVNQIVFQFAKSVAQLPYKLQKQEKYGQTVSYIAGDNRDCVKIDKNGNGLSRLWNQILTTLPMARLETAEAISAKYPTLDSLFEVTFN